LVPRFSSTSVAAWTWPTWVVSRRRVLEVVFVLLEYPSPFRRIFIGSHSLPPLWFAVSVLQQHTGRRVLRTSQPEPVQIVCHVSLPSSYRSRRGHIHLPRVLPLVGCRSKTPTAGVSGRGSRRRSHGELDGFNLHQANCRLQPR
jgi:hypothetical protein